MEANKQERQNQIDDVPSVSDATVLLMLADLVEAGHVHESSPLPTDPVERSRHRMQVMSLFWRHFGRAVWKTSSM